MSVARRFVPAIALAGSALLALAGCAATTSPGSADDGLIRVVAVTDVYGDVAQQLGGDRVRVTSIVSGAAVDPHEYEASTRDQLAIAEADLVIVNGGGLDDFMDRLIEGSGTDAVVISAVEASGLLPVDSGAEETAADHPDDDAHQHVAGFNEHVWYSLHGMEQVAEAIGAALIELDPSGTAQIEADTAAFLEQLDALHSRVHELEEELGGGDIVATEPVSAYLLSDLGLTDVTPEAFLAAVEEGTGVGIGLLDQVLSLVTQNAIRMVAENVQSGGAEADRVRDAAVAAGVPIVAFSETLPSGEDYVSWMSANVEAIASALR